MSGYEPSMLTATADLAVLARTRTALHTLAERVLAPDLHRATGRIGLRVTPGGFGQPERVVDGRRRRARLDGTSLVLDDDGETWHELSTLGAAAVVLGVDPSESTGVYEATSSSDPSSSLVVDPGAASEIAGWFAFVETALEEFRRRHRELAHGVVQLWPEHFDLACSFAEINFGGSPGDGEGEGRVEPYLYVGPWQPAAVGGFWNESYGAARARSEVRDLDDALEFFAEGLAHARQG